ncbi:hypothetical protein ACIBI7_35850 [Nonomuraea fuscirosea]|uniref:hypothetical protein n=1 Tax=Nonomuraea fuscirosea TaxID=1291556 RepID=UPI00378F147D
MCEITITCGSCSDSGSDPQEPPAPYRPRWPARLNGWVAASTYAEACTATLAVPQEVATIYTAKAILSAGYAIDALYVAVHREAAGYVSGEARLAVYTSEFGPHSQTPNLPNLYGRVGFNRGELEPRVEATDQDRIICLVALVPAYGTPPHLLSTAPVPATEIPDDAYQLWWTLSGQRCESAPRSTLPATVGGDSGFNPVDRVVLLTAEMTRSA